MLTIARPPGRLDLALERAGPLTRPRRRLAAPPLQLSRARYDSPARPGQVSFTLLHLGGVLAGDRYELRVELGPGAEAVVLGAAATQVHPMPDGEATQALELRLGPGSRLAWLPEPLLLFAGSRFDQLTRVVLAPEALLLLLDVFVPGRLARGEVFQFERYTGRLEIGDETGRLLAAERWHIEPRRSDPSAPGIFGGTPVLGSLFLLGSHIDAERLSHKLGARGEPELGVAALPNSCGLLVRMLGVTPSSVHTRLLDMARSCHLT